jgi:hypothetical protein
VLVQHNSTFFHAYNIKHGCHCGIFVAHEFSDASHATQSWLHPSLMPSKQSRYQNIQWIQLCSLGWRNSMRPSLYTNFNSIHLLASRPKTIDDVSAQEHTVAVLQKTLTSTNVLKYFVLLCYDAHIPWTSSRICYFMVHQGQERLRPSSHWQGNYSGESLLTQYNTLTYIHAQPRQLPKSCPRAKRLRRTRNLYRP